MSYIYISIHTQHVYYKVLYRLERENFTPRGAKENGSVGGQMVKKMVEAYEKNL